MDDLPPAVTPRFWIAFSILCIAFALCVVMATCTQARAQQRPLCAPAEILLRQFSEMHKERPIWEGDMPKAGGPVEFLLLQGAKNTWSLFTIEGGIACLVAAGQDAAPSLDDRGV